MCRGLVGDGAQTRLSGRHGNNFKHTFLEAALNTTSLQKKEHKLDKDGRPDVITNWQKSGRKYTAMPDLSDKLPSFAASWWQWWRNLQPYWRTQQALLLSREGPENPDWSVLNKGTANGFFFVILSLGWWALGLKHTEVDINNGTGGGMKDLLNAIEDTTWVLQQMALPRLTSTKRPQSEDDNSNVNAKRYIYIFPTLFTLLIIHSFTASKFDPTIETV